MQHSCDKASSRVMKSIGQHEAGFTHWGTFPEITAKSIPQHLASQGPTDNLLRDMVKSFLKIHEGHIKSLLQLLDDKLGQSQPGSYQKRFIFGIPVPKTLVLELHKICGSSILRKPLVLNSCIATAMNLITLHVLRDHELIFWNISEL